jgi:hypothetical protein
MLSEGPTVPLKWYYRPAWVLVLLFLVLGPLALPYLWRSPAFSRRLKIVLTALVLAYTAVFIDETIRIFRELQKELTDLATAAGCCAVRYRGPTSAAGW